MKYRKPTQKRKYTLTRTNVIASLIIIVGVAFWVYGVICGYRLENAKNSYTTSEIKNGRYIEYDISREQLMGHYYSETSGEKKYGIYSVSDVFTGVQTYIVATNENLDCYVPITVSREYQDSFEEMVNNADSTYHLVGKFKRYTKFNELISYDTIAESLGIKDEEEIKSMVSENHKIILVDPKDERSATYKGLSLILFGSLILYSAERMDRRENNSTYVRRKMASIERSKRNRRDE